MRPHREEHMEMRAVAVRNGKCKIPEESRKQNEEGRMGITHTSQQMPEKG